MITDHFREIIGDLVLAHNAALRISIIGPTEPCKKTIAERHRGWEGSQRFGEIGRAEQGLVPHARQDE